MIRKKHSLNGRAIQVDPDQVADRTFPSITIIAGPRFGPSLFAGDGGSATPALFNSPSGIADPRHVRQERGRVIMGQEALKLSPEGKVLMMLGKEGVAGHGRPK